MVNCTGKRRRLLEELFELGTDEEEDSKWERIQVLRACAKQRVREKRLVAQGLTGKQMDVAADMIGKLVLTRK
jgi:hypothetical protein